MIDPKINNICQKLDGWCNNHQIKYDICIDESDLQGVMLFRQNRHVLHELVEFLTPDLLRDRIHVEQRRVRNGIILAFSLEAISEDTMQKIATIAGEVIMKPTLEEKLFDAFAMPVIQTVRQIEEKPVDFFTAAKKIAESQFKTATSGITRSSLQKAAINPIGRKKKTPLESKLSEAFSKTPTKPTVETIKKDIPLILGLLPTRGAVKHATHKPASFEGLLGEALDGMATPSGQQPSELFQKFAQALEVLGNSINIGPLQKRFEQQGIKWKVDADGSNIVLFVQNAVTNAPQPIARISAQTLENPSDFEEQLMAMLDFAKGQAPGTDKQRREEMQAQEKAVREVSQQIAPEKTAVQQAMGGTTPGAAAPQPQAGAPAAPQRPTKPVPAPAPAKPGAAPAPAPAGAQMGAAQPAAAPRGPKMGSKPQMLGGA